MLAGGAFLVGKSLVGSPKKPGSSQGPAPGQSTVTTAAPPATELIQFRNEKVGWAISYPKSWNRLEPKDEHVTLVVSEKPADQNTGGSILARDVPLQTPISDANLAAAKEVTDQLVTGEGVQHITEPKVIHQGGLPGLFYFYKFRDGASGQEGVHSHYFLFKGASMISFVFQALPTAAFQGLANLFDDMIGSFRVL